MNRIKNTLLYKLLREMKNLFLQVSKAVYWQAVNVSSVIKDHFRDKELCIETDNWAVSKGDSLYKDMVDYVPASYDIVERILNYLKPGTEDIFVDFGCGKGRAILLAASRQLKKVIGVDIDSGLLDIAQKNLRNIKTLKTPVILVEADAAKWEIKEGTVFFLYNPFGHKTTVKVIDNIKRSLAVNPRKIYLVYCCAQYRYLFDELPWLELETEMDGGSTVIWRNKTL